MLTRKINYSVGERLQILRAAVEKEFGYSWDMVSTTFAPNMKSNLGPVDVVDLSITGVRPGMIVDRPRVQSFAAETLRKIWLTNRPLVSLHMELAVQEATPPKDTTPPELPPSAAPMALSA